jgi:hypothetical protein
VTTSRARDTLEILLGALLSQTRNGAGSPSRCPATSGAASSRISRGEDRTGRKDARRGLV